MVARVHINRSLQLVEGEAYRQIMAGEAPETLPEFARQLLNWLQASHPDVAPITEMAIERQIRETWHRRHAMIRGEAS
jgi:hypothetical protein